MKKVITLLFLMSAFVGRGQISDALTKDTIDLYILTNNSKSITAAQVNKILTHLNVNKLHTDSAAFYVSGVKIVSRSGMDTMQLDMDYILAPNLQVPGGKWHKVIGYDPDGYLFPQPMSQLFDTMMVYAADSGSVYLQWERDISNGVLRPATETDKIKEVQTQDRVYQGIVSFSFDDGTETDYAVIYPLFQDKGVFGTSYIITSLVGAGGYLTWDEIEEMAAAGWEFGSHTINHPDLRSITADSVDVELSVSKDTLEAHGLTVNNLGYPFNYYNDSVLTVARKHYRSARASFGSGDTLNPQVLRTYALKSLNADDYTDSVAYYSLITNANTYNRWVIFYIHGVDADDSLLIANMIDSCQTLGVQVLTVNAALDLIGNSVDVSDGFAINGQQARIDSTIYRGYDRFLHTYSSATADGFNLFLGVQSGNFTLSPGGGASSLASRNIGIGYQTLDALTMGYNCTAIGVGALGANTTGLGNTAIGQQAGVTNITGNSNTFIGNAAGLYAMGSNSVYIGNNAGRGNSGGTSTADNNVGVGASSLYAYTTGTALTAIGLNSLTGNTTGGYSAAMGVNALYSNSTSSYLTGVGANVGYHSTGAAGTFVGAYAGYGATGTSNGIYNSALGYEALRSFTGSDFSVAIGAQALRSTTSGDNLTAVGYQAGYSNVTGSGSMFFGYRAGYNETGSSRIYLASDSTSWANGMAFGSKLLMYADMSNASKSNHFMNIFAKVAIGEAKALSSYSLEVVGNANFTTYIKTGTGTIADNDASPSVAGGNTFIYSGTANSVSIDALDDHVVGCYYTIIGNSNTYTITVIDGTPAGGDSFNLAGASWVGGSGDVLVLYCLSADNFIEVSRSNN